MICNLKDIDTEQFMVHQQVLNGEIFYLVQPQHIGCKWTQANKHLRSSVWDSDGNLVSAGFPKFVNWGENPNNFPVPTSLKDTTIVEKVDGSLLIVSKWFNKLILRTRGTVDATKLDNGRELELFMQKHGKECEYLLDRYPTGASYSLLFEWVSPNQRIILNYGDQPEWYLVGAVNHEDYSLMKQSDLDYIASEYGFKRPTVYAFPTIANLMSDVEQWKGKEGVVIYSGQDQVLHKVKSFEYLKKHRFKSEATLENTLELYLNAGRPSYNDFSTQLQTTFDYECFEMVRGYVSDIYDASKIVDKIVDGFNIFVNDTLRPLATRREQAEKVLESYSTTNRASMVFAILDGKTLSTDQIRKLFWQVLKK